MKWQNEELQKIDKNLNTATALFRSNVVTVASFIKVAKDLERQINTQIDEATLKLKTSKYPKSNHYSAEAKSAGESQKMRAYMLADKPISLIKSELKKEIEFQNWDFVFTLAENVFVQDRNSVEKMSLSNLYSLALKTSGSSNADDQLKQAKVLREHAIAMGAGEPLKTTGSIDEDIKSKYIQNIDRTRHLAEMNYIRSRENPMRPEYQKFIGE